MQKRYLLTQVSILLLIKFCISQNPKRNITNIKLERAGGGRGGGRGGGLSNSGSSSSSGGSGGTRNITGSSSGGNGSSEPVDPLVIYIILGVIGGIILIIIIACLIKCCYKKHKENEEKKEISKREKAKKRISKGRLVCINKHPLDKHVSDYSELIHIHKYSKSDHIICDVCNKTTEIRHDFYRCREECNFDICSDCFKKATEMAADYFTSDESDMEKNELVFKAHGIENEGEAYDVENQPIKPIQIVDQNDPDITYNPNGENIYSGNHHAVNPEFVNDQPFQDQPFNNKEI